MTKTILGRTFYGWTWWINPKQAWLRLTINRHNEGVNRGHAAARRLLLTALKTYRTIAISKGEDHLAGYDAATRIIEKQFAWLQND